MRWFVEIMEIDGRCQAQVGYTRMPGSTIVWNSTPWTLPTEPQPMQQKIGELMDVCMVFLEQEA